MLFLKELIEKNGDKIVSCRNCQMGKRYVSVFDYSEQNGGTYDSFKYYNDYVIGLGENNMKNIFENDFLVIRDTKQDYDFRYIIENKKSQKVNLYLTGLDDNFELDGNSWVGLFNGDYSDSIVDSIINENYEVV